MLRASGTYAAPSVVAQSYAGWPRTSANAAGDASFLTLASVTVPGGTMGPNSKLKITLDYDYPNSASTKTLALDWGGSNISAPAYTVTAAVKIMLEIINKNSLSSQVILNGNTYTTDTSAHLTSNKDTSGDVVIDIKVKWGGATASETITLLGYSVVCYPGS
jgi:hypothetical protein